VKRTVGAISCAGLALTIFVPPVAAEPPATPEPTPSASGEEICEMIGGNGGMYYLSVTSKSDSGPSPCFGGSPLQASVADLLANPAYGANIGRRCTYDATTDPAVHATVGVYSSERASDRAAADAACQLHHVANPGPGDTPAPSSTNPAPESATETP
jgi:hypothetical protein